jgi:HlyD family secretion protein
MNSKLKIAGMAAAAAAILGLGAWYALPAIRGILVTPVTVVRSDIVQTIVATGRVETPSVVTLGMASAGTVSSVRVNEGDKVGKGDVLVSIDDSDAQSAYQQAQAAVRQSEAKLAQIGGSGLASAQEALAQAAATLKNADQKYERVSHLAITGFISDAAVDDAKQAYDIAQSQVRNAEAAVANASPKGNDFLLAQSALEQSNAAARASEIKLKNTMLLAPADGVIISRSAEVGMVVQSGVGLIEFAPAIAKRLVLLIDERNLGKIKPGLAAIASPDAYPDERFNAVLSFINPIINADRGSFEVKLDVPEPPSYLKEGMTVSVDIEILRRDNALVIDTSAIRDAAGGKPHVLAIVDGKAVEKPVTPGISGGGKSEITDGLAEGDLIVPSALATITAGQKVRIAAPAAK